MKKINFGLLIGIIVFISCQKEQNVPSPSGLALNSQSINEVKTASAGTTAASFPIEVIPAHAGRIEFWGKVLGFHGSIPSSGQATFFAEYGNFNTHYQLSFASNSGTGGGGLVSYAGMSSACTGSAGFWTYESIIPNGSLEGWHHYVLVWNEKGLPFFGNKRKVLVFIDGKLNSRYYYNQGNTYPSLTGGRLLLIMSDANYNDPNRQMAIDEFKIFDKNNNLLLWNAMGSKEEIEHSKVGLNGSFDGFGNAYFIPGKSGNALIATPRKAG